MVTNARKMQSLTKKNPNLTFILETSLNINLPTALYILYPILCASTSQIL
jgi:hypothetical protein